MTFEHLKEEVRKMGHRRFEQLVADLVAAERPEGLVNELKAPDGGLDVSLTVGGRPVEGWQVKHSDRPDPRTPLQHCKSSLETALKHWPEIKKITFVFSWEITGQQHRKIVSELAALDTSVALEIWDFSVIA